MLNKSQTKPEWAVLIKALRKHYKETQTEFAVRFNVTQVAVHYWEIGTYEPPADVLLLAMKEWTNGKAK